MIHHVVVFNSKEEADALQERDYQLYLLTIENELARNMTTAWDIPRQRIDGKWTYFIYPNGDYTGYTIEEYNINNYPMEE